MCLLSHPAIRRGICKPRRDERPRTWTSQTCCCGSTVINLNTGERFNSQAPPCYVLWLQDGGTGRSRSAVDNSRTSHSADVVSTLQDAPVNKLATTLKSLVSAEALKLDLRIWASNHVLHIVHPHLYHSSEHVRRAGRSITIPTFLDLEECERCTRLRRHRIMV
jgi:hypothetical protein